MEIERERVITSNRNIDTRLLITPSFNMWEIEEGRRKGKKKDEEKEKEKKRKKTGRRAPVFPAKNKNWYFKSVLFIVNGHIT